LESVDESMQESQETVAKVVYVVVADAVDLFQGWYADALTYFKVGHCCWSPWMMLELIEEVKWSLMMLE
jgi:hypothetical protein